MCYYSKSMRAGTFREATADDNIIMGSDINGHHFAVSKDDHKVLCIRSATKVHIASLRVRPEHLRSLTRDYPEIAASNGKPLSGTFREVHGTHSNDAFVLAGRLIPFGYFADGMEFYIGEKRTTLETKLGTDDPSIALDHKVETERELVTS